MFFADHTVVVRETPATIELDPDDEVMRATFKCSVVTGEDHLTPKP